MLELRLFGSVDIDTGSASPHHLAARGSLLLAYLALNHGRAVPSSEIVDAVFADSRAEDPHDLVKKAASGIRRALDDEAHRLRSPAPRELELDLAGARVDWLQFQAAVRKGDPDSLDHAIALHVRPLLEAETAHWAVEEQSNALRMRQRALESLFRRAVDAGDLEDAGRRLAQMLRFELPYCSIKEELWRELMAALAARQEYGQILLHYGRLGSFLERTAGRAPEPETHAIYRLVPRSALIRMTQADGKRRKTNLPETTRVPAPPYALIGREQERGQVHAAFKDARLVTLVGIGGVGKTHCASCIGIERAPEYKDGVAFVDLTPCEPGAVMQTIAAALGAKEEPGIHPQGALCRFIGGKRLLVILDNCEHLIDEVAVAVSDVLRDCPSVHLLVTSREALRVAGERVVQLRPLALPDSRRREGSGRSRPITAAVVMDSPAGRLFIERSTARSSAFRLTDDNADMVATLCGLVDGIPLGIEIVASQTAAMPLARVRDALCDSGLGLQHANRGVVPRHRTLHAALDWSHGTLAAAEEALFRRLSVFVGGWSLEAAEQVCSDETLPAADIQPALASLVAKSLVVLEPDAPAALPYRFLETIRAYAGSKADAAAETARFVHAHGRHYADLVAALGDPSNVREFFAEVDRSRSYLYAAMQRSLEEPAQMETGHRICAGLHSYWAHRALRREARDWNRRFLQRGQDILPPSAIAGSMLRIADYCADLGEGDGDEANRCRQEAFNIYHSIGDRKGEADVHFSVGTRLSDRRLFAESYASFEKAYEYYGSSDRYHMLGFLLVMMGGCLTNQGRFEEAEALERRALDLAQIHRTPSLGALALMFLGFNARDRELLDLADRYFLECADSYDAIDSHWGAVTARTHLADIKRKRGDLLSARRLLRGCLADAGEFSNMREAVSALAFAARLARAQTQWAASLKLSLALLALRPEYPDVLDGDAPELSDAVAAARAQLSEPESEECERWAGTATVDALVAYALALLE